MTRPGGCSNRCSTATSAQARAVLAEVHWRSGRHEEAARVLADGARALNSIDWRWTIGPHLAAAVEGGASLQAVFAALSEVRVDPLVLRAMLPELKKGGAQDEPLLEIYRGLKPPGLARLEVVADAASLVQSLRGPAAVPDFLRREIRAAAFPPFSYFAFDRGLDDVLWTLVPLALSDPEVDARMWLVRTAAALRARDESHHTQLRAHYQGDNSSHFHVLGRHLLGLEDEPSVLRAATTATPEWRGG